ncbi:23S rRNA (guanosine2251-2'-O)-methyltransferase [Enterococcus sp. PF1-24]|uniref:23S rRNA (guanosine(2251)-2'-O)-methyltransferase RlmB n=1 Tax=unclassified Enterococcus TaxID=2608891 RepID=UPI002472FA6D|nr:MULTISPECIES: 23S rRNA (guanosine(2251)-2'-O)-methyltransferase RlmB [unclassified Enterococcus]MDH6364830.1 23S rRNA (guanosine2251-2'-O)-methyltransferase [Enterococcus sp. PFB1-1]MDH6401946.1 23S rRNA (guanosine2251-2'-O)-methyltransferase [Enterococcus sp. PF1-24]
MADNKKQFQQKKKRPYQKNDKPTNQKFARKEKSKVVTPEEEAFLAENFAFGHHATIEALKQGKGNKLFIQEDLHGDKVELLKQLAKEQAVPVKWVPKAKLEQWSNQGVHQGVVLATTPYRYLELAELLEQTQNAEKPPFFLILDSLEDPHNFGSILRTADASGVAGVIIPKHRAVGITPVVTKASTGAVEYVPIARVTNLNQAVTELKSAGFWIFGTDMQGTDYRKWNAQGPIALIIGNEGKGMSQGLKKEVDEMLTIPMTGHVQSLNASVAASLLMYEAFYQRGGDSS